MIRAEPLPAVEDAAPDEDPARRSSRLFAGALLVFRGLPPMAALVARARALIVDALADDDPETAEHRLDAATFRARVSVWRTAVARDAQVAAHWRATMEALGYRADDLFGDRLNARVAAARPAWRGRRGSVVPVHRDTWGSNIAAQVNWWGPLYPVTAARTMVLWPALFDRPVANDSADWDAEELRRRLKAGTADGYPLLPSAKTEPPDAEAVPVLIAPGDLLAFSGAHLHASRAADPARARISLDTRTVWAPDLAAGRGAPMVDAAAPRTAWHWFARLSDGRALAPAEPTAPAPP